MGALERAQDLIQAADPNKTLPQCEIRQIEIGPEALFSVGEVVERFLPQNSKIGLIVDKKIIFRQNSEAKQTVREILAKRFIVEIIEALVIGSLILLEQRFYSSHLHFQFTFIS